MLALEETVKARTLGAIAAAAAQGRSPGFSDQDLRKIFYSGHRERNRANGSTGIGGTRFASSTSLSSWAMRSRVSASDGEPYRMQRISRLMVA